MDADLKDEVEAIFAELGLSASQAISIFFDQVRLHHGLPFRAPAPAAATRRALADAEARRNLVSHGSTQELFDELGI